jgi:hypothetical protein
MTTHETQPETLDTTGRHDRPAEEVEVDTQMEPTSSPADSTSGTDPVETDAPAADLETTDMLFADGELSDLRSRWAEVQSAFVDDPRDCVQKADGLVADVVDKLTSGFSEARAQLEEQWDRGEEVSTEDLRIALKRYREFFERLLAV